MRAIEYARLIVGRGDCAALPEFLSRIDHLDALERGADTTHRALIATLTHSAGGPQELYVATHIADALEAATDAFARCATRLRDHVMASVTERV